MIQMASKNKTHCCDIKQQTHTKCGRISASAFLGQPLYSRDLRIDCQVVVSSLSLEVLPSRGTGRFTSVPPVSGLLSLARASAGGQTREVWPAPLAFRVACVCPGCARRVPGQGVGTAAGAGTVAG